MTACPNVAGLRGGEVAGLGRKIVDVFVGKRCCGVLETQEAVRRLKLMSCLQDNYFA